MAEHSTLTDTELHYPRGASQSGVALDLAVSATAYQITDASAHGFLTINTSDSPPTIVWGNTSGDANAQPTYRYYLPDNVSNAWRVSDEGAIDYLNVSTANGSENIALGNATTNPKLTWTGSGAWSVGGGYGTSGQVLTSNGSGAAPTWSAGAAGATGTTSADFEINSGATGAASSTGSLTISTGSGIGDLYKSKVTNSGGTIVVSTTNNGSAISPSVYLGLNSTGAASQSALTFSAANAGTQRTISATWVASTQTLTVAGGVVSLSSAPTAPGGSSSERWGAAAQAPGTNCTAVGASAVAGGSGATGDGSTAVGAGANVSVHRGVGVGWGATASVNDATCIGRASSCGGGFGFAGGSGATANGASVVLCGTDGVTPGRFVVGGQLPITQVLIGNGESAATPGAITYRTTDASGTDHAGADWTFDGSKGTGNAQGGYIRLRAAVSAGVSGSTAGTLTEVLRVDGGAAGGRVGFFGVTPSARVATPATLGDVIALLQAYGLAS